MQRITHRKSNCYDHTVGSFRTFIRCLKHYFLVYPSVDDTLDKHIQMNEWWKETWNVRYRMMNVLTTTIYNFNCKISLATSNMNINKKTKHMKFYFFIRMEVFKIVAWKSERCISATHSFRTNWIIVKCWARSIHEESFKFYVKFVYDELEFLLFLHFSIYALAYGSTHCLPLPRRYFTGLKIETSIFFSSCTFQIGTFIDWFKIRLISYHSNSHRIHNIFQSDHNFTIMRYFLMRISINWNDAKQNSGVFVMGAANQRKLQPNSILSYNNFMNALPKNCINVTKQTMKIGNQIH